MGLSTNEMMYAVPPHRWHRAPKETPPGGTDEAQSLLDPSLSFLGVFVKVAVVAHAVWMWLVVLLVVAVIAMWKW